MSDDKFTIKVNGEMAWLIREVVRPGMPVTNAPANAQEWQRWALELRQKVNDAILRFTDEEGLEWVELNIGEEEAWIIDAVLGYSGTGGAGTVLLTQLFRGLWGLEYALPAKLIPEPSSAATGPVFEFSAEDELTP